MELDFDQYKAQPFCDNPACDYYGKVGEHNMRTHSCLHHHGYCNSCKQIWVITKGPFFYNLQAPVSLILEVLKLLSEGMGLRAVSRSKGVTTDAVSAWVLKAADHINEVTVYLERDMHLTQCQIDEFWSYILKKSTSARRRSGPGGHGRPRKSIRIIDENLKYAQVVKHKEGSRLIEIEKRVIWGTEEDILDIIQQDVGGQTINTSYVESRNGNYRKDNKCLVCRSVCQSKEVALHDAQIDLLTGIYNFVDENRAFRQCINPNANRFEVKYKKYSLAMLEGFADHCLTLEELLMWRVPK